MFSLEKAHDLFTCRPIRFHNGSVLVGDALSVLPFAAITNIG
jgi:hypothetical protein